MLPLQHRCGAPEARVVPGAGTSSQGQGAGAMKPIGVATEQGGAHLIMIPLSGEQLFNYWLGNCLSVCMSVHMHSSTVLVHMNLFGRQVQ